MDEVSAPASFSNNENNKGIPEMTVTDTEKGVGPQALGRGMSIDLGSPYLLPAVLQSSRESLHSLSRSTRDGDPYRLVTFTKSDQDSLASYPASLPIKNDDMSINTSSSDGLSANLLKNASRMSQSFPQRTDSAAAHNAASSEVQSQENTRAQSGKLPSRKASLAAVAPLAQIQETSGPNFNSSSGHGMLLSGQSTEVEQSSKNTASAPIQLPPRNQSRGLPPRAALPSQSSEYSNDTRATQTTSHPAAAPAATAGRYSLDAPGPVIEQLPPQQRLRVEGNDQDGRRLSALGLRPLPPDELVEDPEQRANRIRSFYKEYFDDSRPNPAGKYPQYGDYYEDYPAEHIGDSSMYDPQRGGLINARPQAQRPFAQPVARRAMTPPPQSTSRVQGHPRGPALTQTARPMNHNNRVENRAPMPKKRLPPPSPLTSLPTPHMLKDDMSTFSSLDFAPPTSYRDRQAGRAPDSPLGSPRPYSPTVAAHVPLARSYDDLSVMPSPHALRESKTFTALDFAPPARFKDAESGSDAGSVRSNRSGISAVQRDAIRAGAYRVSRIPKEMVGTRDDVTNMLRPTWDFRGAAQSK
ncbi:hypothetical protein LTR66_009305 [Elasticomyces elasticus]|nr:hypothetical protein LTR66_009305 [Elasticomyces elasticus]